jgi:dipeptide/tripeptide permease
LLAVLWFDLMFDVQARGHSAVPANVRASIAAYYARVTTAAKPMNRLVAVVMVITIGELCAEVAGSDVPTWRASLSLALTLSAVGLAAGRTVRNAVRLGLQSDDIDGQSRLAHLILRDHILCLGAIGATLALQLPHT